MQEQSRTVSGVGIEKEKKGGRGKSRHGKAVWKNGRQQINGFWSNSSNVNNIAFFPSKQIRLDFVVSGEKSDSSLSASCKECHLC
jgi:hypothetical protein